MKITASISDSGKKIRKALLLVVVMLIGVGLIMVYSSSAVYSYQIRDDSLFYLRRHFTYMLIGFLCALMLMRIPIALMKKWVWPLTVGICVCLAATSLFSDPSLGARRWIHLGPLTIQPSEFAKIIFSLCIAHQLADPGLKLDQFKRDLLPLAMPTGIMCLSILAGKDLGTVVVIGSVFLMILFIRGLQIKKLMIVAGVLLPCFVLAILIEPYRVRRILAFLNPLSDTRDSGFQLYQSLLAIGSGGLSGVGIGQSQQKLFYLPAQYTDFIFAIIAEEMGFLGSLAVVLMFVALAAIGLMIISRCQDPFLQVLSLSLVMIILVEAIINIGVSLGLLPTKGLALPFISYGGSSLIAKMGMIGLLMNISKTSDAMSSVKERK